MHLYISVYVSLSLLLSPLPSSYKHKKYSVVFIFIDPGSCKIVSMSWELTELFEDPGLFQLLSLSSSGIVQLRSRSSKMQEASELIEAYAGRRW